MESPTTAGYFKTLLGKKLHLHTTDSRMFVGDFKCTDNERNIILGQAFEYREPSLNTIKAAANASAAPESTEKVKLDMTSRFLGLIVVPGQHITKIEAEET